jgi:hypothetical protein
MTPAELVRRRVEAIDTGDFEASPEVLAPGAISSGEAWCYWTASADDDLVAT